MQQHLRPDRPLDLPWPAGIPYLQKPRANISGFKFRNGREYMDWSARGYARDVREREDAIRCGGTTPYYTELMYANKADFAAVASTASEASLLGTLNEQPVIPATYFLGRERRAVLLEASGVFSNTSTPTLIFQVRLGATAGSSYLSGTSVGVSAAITGGSGVTNKWWYLRIMLVCTIPGIGTGNATLAGAGYVKSPGGFAAPYEYALEPTTPDTATWTSTIDAAVTQYLNLSATWSASSSSNSITCKQLMLWGLN